MSKKFKLKKLLSSILAFIMIFSMVTVTDAEEALESKTLDAAFGTPEIDGKIDAVWDNTNYTFIDRLTPSGNYSYTGWMKALWDKDRIYVLAKIHTVQLSAPEGVSAWKHDCFEVFFDENCSRATKTENDDYQLRANFKGEKSSLNYPENDFDVATSTFDMGFIVEMAIPMKTVSLKSGMKLGFDAQMFRTSNFAFDAARIGWSAYRSDISKNTSDYGTLILRDTVYVTKASIPEFSKPAIEKYSVQKIPYTNEQTVVSNISAMYNHNNETQVSVLHVNEYPCMEINALAELIGASVSNGNTLSKDGINVTYTAGERLMQDDKGNLIMLVKATEYDGKLYVPLSSLETTFLYDIKYNRFKKELDILPFNEPKEAEFVANVRDYGAVGDGVHDDKDAIIKAFNAAMNSGKPAKVELEANKIYYVGETTDNAHMFWISGASDLIFDGNGSTLLLAPSQFGAFCITTSERVRIEDLTISPVVPASSQGWIRGKSKAEGTILLEFEEGYPILPTMEWKTAYNQPVCYLSPIQADTNHSKYISMDYAEINGFEHVEGRLYKAHMASQGVNIIPLVEVGDRFSANYRYYAYDLNTNSKPMWGNGIISINTSGDIELRNVIISSSNTVLGCVTNNTWGNIRLNNFSAVNPNGNIWSSSRDFIHTAGSRGTLLWENSQVIGCGDDIMNTKGGYSKIETELGDRKYSLQANANIEQGDEVLIFNPDDKDVVGRAFVENVEYTSTGLNSERCWIKLDRDIDGLVPGKSAVMNLNMSTAGTVVRNNVFKNGKRWAWVNRSPNCVFEDNYSENMNGSMVAAENELNPNEGPFPSAMTIRNNRYYCDGNGVPTSDPIQVQNHDSSFGDTAAIDGILIEGNTIETSRVGTVIRISDVNELYLLNNKIINHGENTTENMPVTIRNCVISKIDGMTLDYDYNVSYGVNVVGCEYDETNINNINILGDNTMKAFKDWWK